MARRPSPPRRDYRDRYDRHPDDYRRSRGHSDRDRDRRNDRDLTRDPRRDPRRLSPPPETHYSDSRKRERSPERDRARHDRSRERLRDYPSYRDESRDHKRPRNDDRYRDYEPRRRNSRQDEEVRSPRSTYTSTSDRAQMRAREQVIAEEDAKLKAEEAKQAKFAERQARAAKMREKLALEQAQKEAMEHDAAKPQVGDRMGGRFDPKEIAKRAKAKIANLDSAGPRPDSSDGTKKPDLPKTVGKSLGGSLNSAKSLSTVLDIGHGTSKDADAQALPNALLGLEDDDAPKRPQFEKLPDAPLDEVGGYENDEDDEMEEPVAEKPAPSTDVSMKNVEPLPIPDDEVDPLDAFMNELENTAKTSRGKAISRNELQEKRVTYSDDEDGIIDAIGEEDLSAVRAPKNTKKIAVVNHDAIDYEPFRKDFYTEPQELQEMSAEDLKSLRFELDDIQITGRDIPKPVQKFAQFGLGSHVLDIIRGLGFEQPTSIQAQATPAIMSGRDVIGVAKTGSGKTIAFLLPMFRHIKDQRPLEDMEGPIGLIIAPTRELANQIHAGCKPFLKALQLRAACVVGGTRLSDDIAKMKIGAEIVVATPGRLIELLASNNGRILNLRRVTYVVMDEADRMFDMGFEPQINQVLQGIRPDRQCVLFSATFPRKMDALARKLLNDPVQITVGGRSVVPKEITQKVFVIPEAEKFRRLVTLIDEELFDDGDKRVLIFVERQETADMLFLELTRAKIACVSVHGGREQMDREESLADFKAGYVPVMVATSVAARGLDVKQLTLVINYDVPSHLEDYVHRAGRTGRAGATGTAVTLITPEQGRYSIDVVKALTQSETPVPEELQKIADDFWRKVKEGTEKRWGASGFGGHGLEKLAKEHTEEQARLGKLFTGDEPSGEEKSEKAQKIDSKTAEALEAIDGAQAQKTGAARSEAADEIDVLFGKAERKSQAPRPTSTARPGGGANPVSLEARLAAINSRHGGATSSVRAGVSIDNRGPDAGEYFFKLDVNQLPQKARWAVTNRGNVAKVLEAFGVSITTKGKYYAPGTEPGPNDAPKMSLLIEGPTEISVNSAVNELKQFLRDAILAGDNPRGPVGGRYTVV